ncbi:unnamed protein product [Moneuplotes crassus]|uniref:UBR-type domain-containing protein n=1 Tax=Euplotes crassus TaxID=5936 RepID=A0AAD2DBH1_EUPCR|nr:unnamed protein product [Moneuplotes crassus]
MPRKKPQSKRKDQKPIPQEGTDDKDKKALEKKLKKCSYEKGYINQELFACETCYKKKEDEEVNEPNKYGRSVEPAGICLSCLIACHQDHEVYEIWRKNNFRCDCGNAKFNSECRLNPDKDPLNSENSYDHNFYGRYCHCDEKDNGEDDLYQCTYCEDWFHPKCLKPDFTVKLASSDKKEKANWRIICRNCCKKLENFKCKSSKNKPNLDTKEAVGQSKSSERARITRKRKRDELLSQENSQQDPKQSKILMLTLAYPTLKSPTSFPYRLLSNFWKIHYPLGISVIFTFFREMEPKDARLIVQIEQFSSSKKYNHTL